MTRSEGAPMQGLDGPNQAERKTRKLRKLIWPNNEELIKQTFVGIQAERVRNPRHSALFRGTMTELQIGDIEIEQATGLPRIKGKRLLSYAYKQGRWKAVREAFENSMNSITILIGASQSGEVLSPLIWTSENPNAASTFGGGGPQDQVMLILRPDPTRIYLREESSELFSEEDDRILEHAISEKKPFLIDLPDFLTPPGESKWNETILGPYILPSEIETMIRIRGDKKADFHAFLTTLFPAFS